MADTTVKLKYESRLLAWLRKQPVIMHQYHWKINWFEAVDVEVGQMKCHARPVELPRKIKETMAQV